MPLLFSSTLTLATSLFICFSFFKTFHSVRLGVRFRIRLALVLRFRVTVRLSVKVSVWLRFIFYVYFVSAKPVAAAILAAK